MAGMCSTFDKLSPNTRKRFFDGFPNVLRSSAGRELYRQFLQEYFEEENNIIFWEMCNDLIEHYEAKDKETRLAVAGKIFAYAANVGNFINLDEMQLRQLRKALAHPGQNDTVLLEALHDVRNAAFDWLEERYLNFLEWCDSGQQW